jgi:hypothetical protein
MKLEWWAKSMDTYPRTPGSYSLEAIFRESDWIEPVNY